MSKYELTPPGRVIPVNANQDAPVPIGTFGILQTMMPSEGEVETFNDAAAHNIASYAQLADRTTTLLVSVTAHDTANLQIATAISILTASRLGSAALVIAGGIPLTYSPFVALWNTITAVPVAILNPFTGVVDTFAVAVTGLAGVSIRWCVNVYLAGGMIR